jgi:hypothetical protein
MQDTATNESFEKVIRACLDICPSDYFKPKTGKQAKEIGECKCCNQLINSSKHTDSTGHRRRVVLIEIFKAHDKIKNDLKPENMETLKINLQTRRNSDASEADLLLRLDSRWLRTLKGQNDKRSEPDCARIWFTDFIVEIGQTCDKIVQDPEIDLSVRETAAQIQETLKSLQPAGGGSCYVSEILRPRPAPPRSTPPGHPLCGNDNQMHHHTPFPTPHLP